MATSDRKWAFVARLLGLQQGNGENWWLAAVDQQAPARSYRRMNDRTLASWPDHMQSVFRVIGQLMNGKRLYPELLLKLPYEDGTIIADHRVLIIHTSAAELKQRRGRYTIQITGKRIDGRWNMQSGQLEKLSREAALRF